MFTSTSCRLSGLNLAALELIFVLLHPEDHLSRVFLFNLFYFVVCSSSLRSVSLSMFDDRNSHFGEVRTLFLTLYFMILVPSFCICLNVTLALPPNDGNIFHQ